MIESEVIRFEILIDDAIIKSPVTAMKFLQNYTILFGFG